MNTSIDISIMDPFNIVIKTGGKQIDLNIHPQEAGSYKIVYHGALAGELYMGSEGENWEAVSADDLDQAGYPVYEYDETSGHAHLLLDDDIIQQIGEEIRKFQNLV